MTLNEALAICTTDEERKKVNSIWQGHALAAQRRGEEVAKAAIVVNLTEQQLRDKLVAHPQLSFKSIMRNYNLTQKKALELFEAAAREHHERWQAYYDLQQQIREQNRQLRAMRDELNQ